MNRGDSGAGAACVCRLGRRMPAAFHEIDRFCSELRESVLRGLGSRDQFAVELLVREALNNAVLYGAVSDSREHVWCQIERSRNAVAVRVSDSGKGFDWRKYMETAPASAAESGRGIRILSRYAATLRFNEQGNVVEAIRILDEENRYAEF